MGGIYLINFNEQSDIGNHWVDQYAINNNVIYFDSFGVEHIPKKITKLIDNKSIRTNICRTQAYDSVMCGYFCT